MSRIFKAYDREVFQISEHFIKAIFPYKGTSKWGVSTDGTDNGTDNGIDNGTDEILSLLSLHPEMTIKELSVQLGCSVRKVNRLLKGLREYGRIQRIGSPRKGHWKIV